VLHVLHQFAVTKSPQPSKPKNYLAKRRELTLRLADIVMAEGLADLGLRPAAARLATSDRMLLYYFGSKAELVLTVLACISERLSLALSGAGKPSRVSPDVLLTRASALVADPATVPFMRIWIEISAMGARGQEPYRSFAHQTVAAWLDWINARLDLPSKEERRHYAAAILTILEGATLLELSHPQSTFGVAALLSKAMRKRAQ
jgi:AcrR family transcriptional regulator